MCKVTVCLLPIKQEEEEEDQEVAHNVRQMVVIQ